MYVMRTKLVHHANVCQYLSSSKDVDSKTQTNGKPKPLHPGQREANGSPSTFLDY